MRITTESNKTVLLVGIEEIELLYGLVNTCMKSFPQIDKTEEKNSKWSEDRRRMHQMMKTMAIYMGMKRPDEAMLGYKHKYKKDTPCPYCEKTLRSAKGLESHISKVHNELSHPDSHEENSKQ